MLHWFATDDIAPVMIVRATMTSKLSQAGRKILFPLFLSGWMVSCSPLNPFGWAQDYLDIAKLEEISNQRTVNVQGIVVNVAPFLEGGAYQIQDKTGRVWVKTDRQLPKKGTVLSIRGEVAFEAIFIGPEKLGESYLVETTSPRQQTTEGNTDTPTTATTVSNPGSTTTVEVIESETLEEPPTPPASAANLMPPAQASTTGNQPTIVPVANPEATRPIANSVTAQPPTPARPNLDDQFLPHKRFAK